MPPKTATKKASEHPSFQDMIIDAIVGLKERQGSSRIKLKQYVKNQNKLNITDAMFDTHFNKALRAGVEKGVFEQPKGTSGTTKLARKKPAVKKEKSEKKPAVKKSAAPKAAKKAGTTATTKKAAGPKKEKTEKKPAAATKAKKPAAPKVAKKAAAPKAAPAVVDKPAVLGKTKSGRVTKTTPKTPAEKTKKAAAPKKASAAAPKKA